MDVAIQNYPYLLRAGSFLRSTMLLIMTTGCLNYDLYFFSPALNALDNGKINSNGHEHQYRTLSKFLNNSFTIEQHASNFIFSNNETKSEFLERFLDYIEIEGSVPYSVRKAAEKLKLDISEESHSDPFDSSTGFIKPLPIYITVRIVTLLAELDYGLRKIVGDGHIDSIEEIIKYLTHDFQPEIDGVGLNLNEGTVWEIVNATSFGFLAENHGKDTRLYLSNGVLASKENKELFEFLLPKVKENVKEALNTVIPYL